MPLESVTFEWFAGFWVVDHVFFQRTFGRT